MPRVQLSPVCRRNRLDRTCLVRDGSGVMVQGRSEDRRSQGARAYLIREFAELALLIAVLALIKRFVEIPIWVLVGLPLAKLFSSAGFYVLLLRRAFRRPGCAGAERLVGRTAAVVAPLDPSGFVKVGGEIWSAESADGVTIPQHGEVEITAVHGNTILVVRLARED